jgi:NitT/TauT family transport system substrate-binding protein
MNMRNALRRLALALTFTAAAITSGAAQSKVKIAVIDTNESQLPIRMAIDLGLFTRENIDVEFLTFKGGGIAIQALVGGSIDLCTCATDHIVRLANRNIDGRILVGIDRFLTNALIVPSDSSFTDLASLRGRRIGVSAPGSYSDNTLRWAIKTAGLDPDNDFVIVGVGHGSSARAALQTGRIDAVMLPTPDVLDFTSGTSGRYKILIDWRNVDHSGQAILGRRKWIDADPVRARAVVRAIVEAERLIQSDRAIVERVLKSMLPERSDAFIKDLASEITPRLSPDGSVSSTGFKRMLEMMTIVEPSLTPVEQSAVDDSPVLTAQPSISD